MNVLAYRVTERKLEEVLGDSYVGYFKPLKSKRLLLFLKIIMGIGHLTALSQIIILVSAGIPTRKIILLTVSFYGVVVVLGLLLTLRILKRVFRPEIARKMRVLVNDPELLWLNSQEPLQPVSKWGRSNKGLLTPTTFQILQYLKKEGTAQGIHTKIRSMKNSNSAYQTLKRLAEKQVFNEPIIKRENHDFRYVPWEFRLVDERNNPLNTEKSPEKVRKKAQRIEKFLKKSWERMLNGEVGYE